jgi:hypothetical protein
MLADNNTDIILIDYGFATEYKNKDGTHIDGKKELD